MAAEAQTQQPGGAAVETREIDDFSSILKQSFKPKTERAATEVENAVTFQLAAGETKYIKTAITPGILVGHVTPTLQFPEQGQSDVSSLRYVGPKF